MSERENKEPQNKIKYKLGVEFYKNETEKEMDGFIVTKFDIPLADVERVAAFVQEAIKEAVGNADQIVEAITAAKTAGELPAEAPSIDSAQALALAWDLSEKGTRNLVPVFRSGEYWFHLFNADEMSKQRRTMFEKTEAETAEQFQEPSLDAVLGNIDEQPPVDLDAGGLTLTKNFYFSKSGELLNGLPDFWMVKAGLL